MLMYSGDVLYNDPDVTEGTFDVLTCVFNGATSEFRTGSNVAATGNAGTGNAADLFIGIANNALSLAANIELAYIIIRSSADDTATQDLLLLT